jgi:hypothetical protein
MENVEMNLSKHVEKNSIEEGDVRYCQLSAAGKSDTCEVVL